MITTQPLVSIICLCYNHAPFVREALDSVVAQRYKNIEIIIVDDCSLDASVKVIQNWHQEYPEATFIQNAVNQGNTKSFNQAASIAKGVYIMDFATDDLLLPDAIENLVNGFNIYPTAGIVYGNAFLINEKGQYIQPYFEVNTKNQAVHPYLKNLTFRAIISGENIFCSVSALMNKHHFDRLGGYDEALAYEDLDYWLRLIEVAPIHYIDVFVVKRRTVASSLSQQFYKNNQRSNQLAKSTLKICKKAFTKCQSIEDYQSLQRRLAHETKKYFHSGMYLKAFDFLRLYCRVFLKSIF